MSNAEKKYIKTDSGHIVIFSKELGHKQFIELNPTSAGFCRFSEFPTEIRCYGFSSSLNLDSNEEDSILATEQILGTYYANKINQ